jgi:predicted nucleotidyltransferase
VRRLLAVHFPDAEVWAYGSRVSGTAHEGGDLDLVVRNPADFSRPFEDLDELREAFRESDLLILVDLLDWARVPESIGREITRGKLVVCSAGRAN